VSREYTRGEVDDIIVFDPTALYKCIIIIIIIRPFYAHPQALRPLLTIFGMCGGLPNMFELENDWSTNFGAMGV